MGVETGRDENGCKPVKPIISESIEMLRYHVQCQICKEKLKVRLLKEQLESAECYPLHHIIIHGNPAHALSIYIDANGKLRGRQATTSLQIDDVVLNQTIRSDLVSKLWKTMMSWTKIEKE
ncbi:MAG: hypothetical protein ACFFCS_14030 [Candidatus Hodarchaeota archaeon]